MNSFKPADPKSSLEYFQQKVAHTTGPVELNHARDKNWSFNIIDVRAASDFREGHVPGSVNLPEDDWTSFKGLSKDKVNVLLCYSHVCHLAARAAVVFATAGYPVMEMDGGWQAWKDHELPVETASDKIENAAA